jgi:hypothetical protein
MLIRIVYYSERNTKVGLDMKRMRDSCERNNGRDGIGGFLHYNGTYFLQVLEGEREVVSACYDRIRADGSHTNLVLIGAEPITVRKFESWTMDLDSGSSKPSKETFLANFAASTVDPSLIGP